MSHGVVREKIVVQSCNSDACATEFRTTVDYINGHCVTFTLKISLHVSVIPFSMKVEN